jgi:hypothetical protein
MKRTLRVEFQNRNLLPNLHEERDHMIKMEAGEMHLLTAIAEDNMADCKPMKI